MDKNEFNAHSWEICDQALSNLRIKHLSPLPINYQNEFNTLLEQQVCDELTCEAYHQESINNDVNKYLEIAKLALDAFVHSNQEIGQVMSDHSSRMGPSHGYNDHYLHQNCSQIVDNLSKLDTEMSNALLKAHDQILHLSKKIDTLTKENSIDPLTKFYNRKELFKDLVSITGNIQNKDTESGCYLLMIDLDDFKTINDTYSHMAGDKTLVFIAKTIAAIIRSSDKAYRFGGDEFILVLNRASFDVAKTIAEKIRFNIEKARLYYENNEIHVTVSIGITRLHEKEFENALLKADRALYAAKRNQKNQVYIIDEEA